MLNEQLEQEQNTEPTLQQETAPEAPKAVEVSKPDTNKEYNLRVLRERAERAEARLAELSKYEQPPQRPVNPISPQSQPQVEEDDNYGSDDSLVEMKDLKRLRKELKETKQQVAQYNQTAAQSSAEMRLQRLYSDFDSIVTPENIKNLAAIHPEEYSSIIHNPDLFAKGKTAYNMIKNFGLINEYEQQDKRIQENKAKPRSASSAPASSADNTPLSQIGEYGRRLLTPEKKAQLIAESTKWANNKQ